VIQRDDGSSQIAYKGKPLYYWVKDGKAGDTTGDGVMGVWHTARP
jgi:predicted lipoprotein with Yx(FWY)xxD motif